MYEALEKVTSSEHHIPADAFLAHFFRMYDDTATISWQVGFCTPSQELIVFTVTGDAVQVNPPAEAFSDQKEILPFAQQEEVTFNSSDAVDAVISLLRSEHPGHDANQIILLAQTLPSFGSIYNVTVVTKTFHLFNVKCSVVDGAVLHKEFSHIWSLRKD